MRSCLSLVALCLLWQGAAQAQYIPANPYPPVTRIDPNQTIIPWTRNQNVVPWILGSGDIDPTNEWIRPYLQNGTTLITVAPANLLNTRVSLDLDHVPLRDAITKLFDQAAQDCSVELDRDAPQDIRITLRAKNIKFLTALNAITEQANLIWQPNLRLGGLNAGPRSIFRLSKAPPESKAPSGTILYDRNSPGNIYLPYNKWYYHYDYTSPLLTDPSRSDLYWKREDSSNPRPYIHRWQPDNSLRLFYDTTPVPNLLYRGQSTRPKDRGAKGTEKPKQPIPDGSLLPETGTDRILVSPDRVDPDPPWEIQTAPQQLQTDSYTIAPFYVQLDRSAAVPLELHIAPSTTRKPLHMQLDRSQSLLYQVTGQEEHATFICPHCKRRITIVRKKPTQHSAAAQNDWHFCPNCGKPVR